LHFRALTTENRATVVNARVARGHTVLITGIGGGVALLALRLCLALGARVYVTSSSDAKIARAVALGASGGVNYTHSQYEFSLP
jgi:NADPH:quinone reductase-like Zn-dependent oxidoreductase